MTWENITSLATVAGSLIACLYYARGIAREYRENLQEIMKKHVLENTCLERRNTANAIYQKFEESIKSLREDIKEQKEATKDILEILMKQKEQK